MVSVVDGEDRPGKAEIGTETVGLAVGRDFLGVGDNSTRIFRSDLEHLQVVNRYTYTVGIASMKVQRVRKGGRMSSSAMPRVM